LVGLGALVVLGGVVIVGLLVPLALQLRGEAAVSPGFMVASPVLILVGGFLLRAAIVFAGQGLL
jgi:formate-dependent nitrite reductase membrane component NrfD